MEYVSGYGTVKGVALEACTGSSHFADELRARSGWAVELCHPGYVQRMRHNPDKTDASDSYLLADLHRVGYLPKVWLAPESLRDLRTLVRHRARCTVEVRDTKLRIRSILRRERVRIPADIRDVWSKKKGRPWLAALTCFLPETQWVFNDLLEQLDNQLARERGSVERLEVFAKKDALIQRLLKIKGVGILTATALRAEVGTFTRFKTGKELSRFCGLTPRNASSGQRQADAGLIKAGNPVLRTSLVQVGHLLCRYHDDYRLYAQQLLERGKHKSVIIAAVANRWLRRLFYDLRDFELGRVE
jgi:transposase